MQRTSKETSARFAEIHQGRLAYHRGVPLDACPHPASSPLAEWWRHGWSLEEGMATSGRGNSFFPS